MDTHTGDLYVEQYLRNRARDSGETRITCPLCSAGRKHHRTDRCATLRRDGDTLLFYCHHCDASMAVPVTERVAHKPRLLPPLPSLRNTGTPGTPGTPAIEPLAWLQTERKIGPEIAKAFGVISAERYIEAARGKVPCVGFPYRDKAGQVIATKFRSAGGKGFICDGSPGLLYGIDRVPAGAQLYITEGEIDALSMQQAFQARPDLKLHAVSVPTGAPNTVRAGRVDPSEDTRFRFIWSCKEQIDSAERVIIATDNDPPGDALAEELARRIGKGRCWRLRWPQGVKDANQLLMSGGEAPLLEAALMRPEPWPVVGLYTARHYADQVRQLYQTGMGTGEGTGLPSLDLLYTVVPGQMTVVTGVPSSGKSELIDMIMVNIARRSAWKFAICSFENPPPMHIAKLAEKYIGQPFHAGPSPRMSPAHVTKAVDWVHDHFGFIDQTNGDASTIESVLDRAHAAVQRMGCRGLVIDPFNYIALPRKLSETQEISDMLTLVRAFARAHDTHVFFVAHPMKLQRQDGGQRPVPTGYDIAGSAAWYSKADFGLTVQKTPSFYVEAHIWKARFKWFGKEGKTTLNYDRATGRYSDLDAVLPDPIEDARTYNTNVPF